MTTTIKKLKTMPYAQAHIEIDDEGTMYLFSYRTLVAGVDKDGWAWCNGTYSRTTIRHIGAFAKEVAGKFNTNVDYFMFKSMYIGEVYLNVATGEVIDRYAS